jgi:hypothetical protein
MTDTTLAPDVIVYVGSATAAFEAQSDDTADKLAVRPDLPKGTVRAGRRFTILKPHVTPFVGKLVAAGFTVQRGYPGIESTRRYAECI